MDDMIYNESDLDADEGEDTDSVLVMDLDRFKAEYPNFDTEALGFQEVNLGKFSIIAAPQDIIYPSWTIAAISQSLDPNDREEVLVQMGFIDKLEELFSDLQEYIELTQNEEPDESAQMDLSYLTGKYGTNVQNNIDTQVNSAADSDVKKKIVSMFRACLWFANNAEMIEV